MILFDWLMKAPDSYWKRQWKAEEIRRKAAEADRDYYAGTYDNMVDELDRISEQDLGQYHAIALMEKEISKLHGEMDKLNKSISDKEREIVLLHEALRTERELTASLRMNSKLWENIKQQTKGELT